MLAAVNCYLLLCVVCRCLLCVGCLLLVWWLLIVDVRRVVSSICWLMAVVFVGCCLFGVYLMLMFVVVCSCLMLRVVYCCLLFVG